MCRDDRQTLLASIVTSTMLFKSTQLCKLYIWKIIILFEHILHIHVDCGKLYQEHWKNTNTFGCLIII